MRLAGEYEQMVVDGRHFVLFRAGQDGRQPAPFAVNETGLRMLEILREDRPEEQIMDILLEEYEVPRDVLGKDVADFIAQLRSFGVLESLARRGGRGRGRHAMGLPPAPAEPPCAD